jgi:hypothetical protein
VQAESVLQVNGDDGVCLLNMHIHQAIYIKHCLNQVTISVGDTNKHEVSLAVFLHDSAVPTHTNFI